MRLFGFIFLNVSILLDDENDARHCNVDWLAITTMDMIDMIVNLAHVKEGFGSIFSTSQQLESESSNQII